MQQAVDAFGTEAARVGWLVEKRLESVSVETGKPPGTTDPDETVPVFKQAIDGTKGHALRIAVMLEQESLGLSRQPPSYGKQQQGGGKVAQGGYFLFWDEAANISSGEL